MTDRRAAPATATAPGARRVARPRLHVWPWLRRPGGLLLPSWLAITIGRDVWSWRPLDAAELAHEMTHVRQWSDHGVLYAVRYLIGSWRARRRGGHWYRDNAFEVEARAAADLVAAAAADLVAAAAADSVARAAEPPATAAGAVPPGPTRSVR